MVVRPRQDVPSDFADTPRVRVDGDVCDDRDVAMRVAGRLRARWAAREATVVELAVHPDVLKQPETDHRPAYEVGARFLFPREHLRHLVWSNNYDLRGGEPVWWPAVVACRTGAGPSSVADVAVEGVGPVWIDGGPRGPLLGDDIGGHAVVHRESVVTGRLTVSGGGSASGDLAADQLAAVSHRCGAARIVAPAGSGKTRVLTARLRHLVVDRRVEADLVTALAYNTRAAAEMRDRTADFSPHVRTLHSLGYEVVRTTRPHVRVLDERAVRDVVAQIAPVRPQANTDVHAPYLEALAQVRLGLVGPEDVARSRQDVPEFARVFTEYRRRLAGLDAIDFDEQIYEAVEILLTRPDIRRAFQRRCRHVLLDEAQDQTPAMILLVRLLAAPAWQVTAVGDDDQAIYGYMGADPSFLVGYDDWFDGAAHYALEVNYRCPPSVVDAATALLGHNRNRVSKTIRSAPGRPRTADELRIVSARIHELARAAVDAVRSPLDDGADPGDVAVLCRVNALLLPVQLALAAAAIPSTSPVGAEVLGRTGVATALAWVRLATAGGRLTGPDVAVVLRRSARKVTRDTLQRIASRPVWTPRSLRSLAFEGLSVWEGKELRRWLDEDLAQVRTAAGRSTVAALDAVRDVGGLDDAMEALDTSAPDHKRAASHVDDLDALTQSATLHRETATFETWLRAQLRDRPGHVEGSAVQLATVHATKGCEFPHVVVFAANAGLMPHRLARAASADLEEERRVFHVALTRARDTVTIVTDRERPSPYLSELGQPGPTANFG